MTSTSVGTWLRAISLITAITILAGCATTTSGKWADRGFIADAVTTGIGIGTDVAKEANPLAPIGILRPFANRYVEKNWTCENAYVWHRATAATSWGAAMNNLVVIVASTSGIAPGILAAILVWYFFPEPECEAPAE